MTTATRKRPIWRRIRKLYRLIARDGLYPTRAADLAGLDLDEHPSLRPRLDRLIHRAEARFQRGALHAVATAGTKQLEYKHPSNAPGSSIAGSIAGRSPTDGSRARTPDRVWDTKDWRAPAWLLERRFPQEYGAQPTVVVDASPVLAMAQLLAQLRASSPADVDAARARLASRVGPRMLTPGETPDTGSHASAPADDDATRT